MARKLQWCQKIGCGRAEAHRTRRVNADGRPDSMGKHGNCGQNPRGKVKTILDEKFKKEFRPARRLRSKFSPVGMTFQLECSYANVAPGTPETQTTLLAIPPSSTSVASGRAVSPETPRKPLAARACGKTSKKNVVPARACGNAQDQRQQRISSANSKPLSLFHLICEYIDQDAASNLLDEGQRHGLKATAFQLSKLVVTNRQYQSVFEWIGNAAVQTTELMKQRRSWALAVLLTALSLSPHMPDIPPRILATKLESDVVIRGSACKTQPRIVDLVYRDRGCQF